MQKTKNELGYADLMPLRILATIVFVMALIALPKFMDHLMLSKLMPVLDSMRHGVEVHYNKNKALPELERVAAIANNESVGVVDARLSIDLALIDEDLHNRYLQLQPYMESGEISWECTFTSGLYKDDLPVMRKGICHNATQSLMERSLWDRAVKFLEKFWKLVLGYILLLVATFLFG